MYATALYVTQLQFSKEMQFSKIEYDVILFAKTGRLHNTTQRHNNTCNSTRWRHGRALLYNISVLWNVLITTITNLKHLQLHNRQAQNRTTCTQNHTVYYLQTYNSIHIHRYCPNLRATHTPRSTCREAPWSTVAWHRRYGLIQSHDKP